MAGRGCGENAGKGKRNAGKVDVTEFIEVSRNDVDPKALAKELADEFDRALSSYGITQDQLELSMRV
jgi:hypothetical protein